MTRVWLCGVITVALCVNGASAQQNAARCQADANMPAGVDLYSIPTHTPAGAGETVVVVTDRGYGPWRLLGLFIDDRESFRLSGLWLVGLPGPPTDVESSATKVFAGTGPAGTAVAQLIIYLEAGAIPERLFNYELSTELAGPIEELTERTW